MTASLPDFDGESVASTLLKFTGVGTGFTGLDVRPIVMELDETAFFVVKVRASESASHKRDKDGNLVRLQRVSAEDMAPISPEIAQQALAAYAQSVEAAKTHLDGQAGLFDRDDTAGFQGRSGHHPIDEPSAAETAAVEREAKDDTDSPTDIAQAAAKRAKQARAATPAFVKPAAD